MEQRFSVKAYSKNILVEKIGRLQFEKFFRPVLEGKTVSLFHLSKILANFTRKRKIKMHRIPLEKIYFHF